MTPYRDSAEVLEETRQDVETKKWKRREKRMRWLRIFGKTVMVVVAVLGVSWLIWAFYRSIVEENIRREKQHQLDEAWKEKLRQDRISGDCSLFAHDKIGDIPVRCISYYQDRKQ